VRSDTGWIYIYIYIYIVAVVLTYLDHASFLGPINIQIILENVSYIIEYSNQNGAKSLAHCLTLDVPKDVENSLRALVSL